MATSVYSWVLDQIRRGTGQVTSYYLAKQRFIDIPGDKLLRQWVTAWAGKYTADLMRNNENSRLEQFLNAFPDSENLPGPRSSSKTIQSWFNTLALAPFDFNAVYAINKGGVKEYGQWRYETGTNDTYKMIITTAIGTIKREYIMDEYGDIEFVREVFISSNLRP
jgi:hypothetical protein